MRGWNSEHVMIVIVVFWGLALSVSFLEVTTAPFQQDHPIRLHRRPRLHHIWVASYLSMVYDYVVFSEHPLPSFRATSPKHEVQPQLSGCVRGHETFRGCAPHGTLPPVSRMAQSDNVVT